MKTSLLAFLLILSGAAFAQAPQSLNYQAVARDTGGSILVNRPLGLRFTIHDSSATGAILYRETDSAATNQFGLFTVAIGQGIPDSGSFHSIPWNSGNKYLQTELDISGGSNYTTIGTAQLLSVPFSLFAQTAQTALTAINSYWSADGNNIYNSNAGNVGIGTNSPLAALHVMDSSVLFSASGTVPAQAGPVPLSGPGRRTLWYADKAAFRTGQVSGMAWDADSIGIYSFGAGLNASASGMYAVAMGNGGAASGMASFATGISGMASGDASTAMGAGTFAPSYAEIALGLYNTLYAVTSPNSWNVADRLLVVGNGTGSFARSDAFVILKNGNIGIGASSPSYALDVNGDIRISGDLHVQNNRAIIRSTDTIQLKSQVVNVYVGVTVAAGASVTVPVTWTEGFSFAPSAYVGDVTGGTTGWQQVIHTISGTNASGATLNVFNPKATSVTLGYYINIIAIGPE